MLIAKSPLLNLKSKDKTYHSQLNCFPKQISYIYVCCIILLSKWANDPVAIMLIDVKQWSMFHCLGAGGIGGASCLGNRKDMHPCFELQISFLWQTEFASDE